MHRKVDPLAEKVASASTGLLAIATGMFCLFPRRLTQIENFSFGWVETFQDLQSWALLDHTRFWSCLWILFFWIGISALLIILGKKARYPGPIVLLLGSFGCGIFILLSLTGMGLKADFVTTRLLLSSPAIFAFLSLCFLSLSKPSAPRLSPAKKVPHIKNWDLSKFVLSFLGFRALFVLVPLILWAAIRKPPPRWDEATFWWIAVKAMNPAGFWGYLNTFTWTHYDPAFPLLGTVFLTPISPSLAQAASPILGVLTGVFFMFLIFQKASLSTKQDRIRFGLILSTFLGLILLQPWTVLYFFQYLNGDSWGAIALLSVFLTIDMGKIEQAQTDTLQKPLLLTILQSMQYFGIGALAVLIKPPLSLILVPTLSIWILIKLFLWVTTSKQKKALSPRLKRMIFICLGAISALYVWRRLLSVLHKSPNYSYELKSLLTFDPSILVHEIFPLWLSGARLLTLGVFFICTLLVLKSKYRFLFQFFLALGMLAAICLVYATVWRAIETESSGRYMLQGAIAWIFYTLIMFDLPFREKS